MMQAGKMLGLNDSGQLGQGHITDIGTSSDHITDLDDINLDSKHKSVSLALGINIAVAF